MTFEEQVKRLEEILQSIEEGMLPLEQLNKLFEEGVGLCKSSLEMLEKSKGKITKLQQEIGQLVEKPFE